MRTPPLHRPQLIVCIAGTLAAMTPPAAAQTAPAYPGKPVRIIVSSPSGGSPDILTRILAQRLGDAMNQQVIVDNRAGAGGTIGAGLAARAAPDGYTLLVGHIGTFGVNSTLYPKLPYDPIKDFQPISLFARVPNMLVVNPALPVKTVKDLVALAKLRPGELNYGSAGNGSAAHLLVEYFKLLTKTNIQHVPYRGTAPAMTDLIAGQVSLTITGLPPLLPQVRAGKLRALGVTTATRLTQLPEVPTIIEAGIAGYEVTQWFGLMAPAATPKEIVARLLDETHKALQRPELRERFAAEATDPSGNTPEQFAAFVVSEIARWAPVVRASGARPE
jgi:tripartite-type tricarboxylate transporter receptor subunit TctC